MTVKVLSVLSSGVVSSGTVTPQSAPMGTMCPVDVDFVTVKRAPTFARTWSIDKKKQWNLRFTLN